MYDIENQLEGQKERLDFFLKELEIKQLEFSNSIGTSQAYISQILKGKKHLTNKLLLKITNSYKNLNIKWLLTGQGEMEIKNIINGNGNSGNSQVISMVEHEERIKELELRIKAHEETIAALKEVIALLKK